MSTAAALRVQLLRAIDEVGKREPNHMVGALDVDLPVAPPALRIAFADLDPRAQIPGIRIGHVDPTELRHTIGDRGLDLFGHGDIADGIGAARLGVGRLDPRLRLFQRRFGPGGEIDGGGACLGEGDRGGLADPRATRRR